jgi:hypothetical protein
MNDEQYGGMGLTRHCHRSLVLWHFCDLRSNVMTVNQRRVISSAIELIALLWQLTVIGFSVLLAIGFLV